MVLFLSATPPWAWAAPKTLYRGSQFRDDRWESKGPFRAMGNFNRLCGESICNAFTC